MALEQKSCEMEVLGVVGFAKKENLRPGTLGLLDNVNYRVFRGLPLATQEELITTAHREKTEEKLAFLVHEGDRLALEKKHNAAAHRFLRAFEVAKACADKQKIPLGDGWVRLGELYKQYRWQMDEIADKAQENFLAAGKTKEAYDIAMKIGSKHPKYETYFEPRMQAVAEKLHHEYFAAGKYAEALELRLLEIDPNCVTKFAMPALKKQFEALLAAGKFAEAERLTKFGTKMFVTIFGRDFRLLPVENEKFRKFYEAALKENFNKLIREKRFLDALEMARAFELVKQGSMGGFVFQGNHGLPKQFGLDAARLAYEAYCNQGRYLDALKLAQDFMFDEEGRGNLPVNDVFERRHGAYLQYEACMREAQAREEGQTVEYRDTNEHPISGTLEWPWEPVGPTKYTTVYHYDQAAAAYIKAADIAVQANLGKLALHAAKRAFKCYNKEDYYCERAFRVAKKYGLGNEHVNKAAKDAFKFFMRKEMYADALGIADELGIDIDGLDKGKVLEAARGLFEKKCYDLHEQWRTHRPGDNAFDEALEIANKYGIEEKEKLAEKYYKWAMGCATDGRWCTGFEYAAKLAQFFGLGKEKIANAAELAAGHYMAHANKGKQDLGFDDALDVVEKYGLAAPGHLPMDAYLENMRRANDGDGEQALARYKRAFDIATRYGLGMERKLEAHKKMKAAGGGAVT